MPSKSYLDTDVMLPRKPKAAQIVHEPSHFTEKEEANSEAAKQRVHNRGGFRFGADYRAAVADRN